MKLENLVEDCNSCYAEIEIGGLSFDSRLVKKGDLFFCLDGRNADGHDFAAQAVASGAVALVVNRLLSLSIPQIVASDTRSAMAIAASNFYGNPSNSIKMVGITGTNGKTTTSYILKSILEEHGEKVGLIGTTAIIFGNQKFDASLTTPDPIELNRILKAMADDNVTIAVMEVSAHALALNKLDGVVFDVAGFTNLSRDHLDFFIDMQAYSDAKLKLFTLLKARLAVVNIDDKLGQTIVRRGGLPIITYGCENPADAFAIDLTMSVDGLEYVLNINDDIGEVKFNLPGRFNMYNTLCAASLASALGASMNSIVDGIGNLKKVDGRFNIINTSKFSVIIDFAHTDDGLKNILSAIREFADNRIMTVFGCGGNRDKTKRPIMGEVACKNSDWCYVTSDNPRSEVPEDIISDIVFGIKACGKRNYCAYPDRKEAIKAAFSQATIGDVVLIAGKGAEKYQEIMGVKQPYNDEQYVLELIKENNL